ncbi:MAG: hypothetical protein ACODAQ_04280 [Phycisphaeraceae bacterium]
MSSDKCANLRIPAACGFAWASCVQALREAASSDTVIRHSTLCFAALLAIVWTATPARAVTPAVLVDDELQAQRVRVTGLNGERISYFDAQRRLRTESIEQVVQLRAIGDERETVSVAPTAALPVPEGAALVLADGQRLAGEWIGASDDGNALRWRHPLLGEVSIALDRLRGWRVGDAEADVEIALDDPPAEDRVVLSNGDALSGFVTQVDEAGLSLQQGDDPEPIALPRERIAGVVLANPASVEAGTAHRVVLADGSAMDGHDLTMRSEQVRFEPVLGDGEPIAAALTQVKRIDFTGTGRRLVALSACERQVSGGDVFGLAMLPRVAADGALWLHAPVTVVFTLPSGAERLAMRAELADEPAAVLEWADLELVVTMEDQTRRFRLNREQPTASLDMAVAARSLRLELLAGVNGPVLDRLWLRDAVVLVVEPRGEAGRQ